MLWYQPHCVARGVFTTTKKLVSAESISTNSTQFSAYDMQDPVLGNKEQSAPPLTRPAHNPRV